MAEEHDPNDGEDSPSVKPQHTTLVPPHWLHRRHESYISVENSDPGRVPITLQDNTGEDSTGEQAERSSSCWARAVAIEDYVLVSGAFRNVGTFVVFNCKVDTLDVRRASAR